MTLVIAVFLSCVQEHSSPIPDVSAGVIDDAEESPKASPPKVVHTDGLYTRL